MAPPAAVYAEGVRPQAVDGAFWDRNVEPKLGEALRLRSRMPRSYAISAEAEVMGLSFYEG